VKQGRVKLDAKSYRELCQRVLERDSWRCQQCGDSKNLQVHHIRWRSKLGSDSDENLITLCANCHRKVHCSTVARAENPMKSEVVQFDPR
jgi:5-methylcytosine-specific restriction endonuclease McrA